VESRRLAQEDHIRQVTKRMICPLLESVIQRLRGFVGSYDVANFFRIHEEIVLKVWSRTRNRESRGRGRQPYARSCSPPRPSTIG
jgi:hypothetical protein